MGICNWNRRNSLSLMDFSLKFQFGMKYMKIILKFCTRNTVCKVNSRHLVSTWMFEKKFPGGVPNTQVYCQGCKARRLPICFPLKNKLLQKQSETFVWKNSKFVHNQIILRSLTESDWIDKMSTSRVETWDFTH